MASRGFEFVGNLDGTNTTPVVKTFTLGAAAAHAVGDLMLVQSDGYIDKVTGSTTEVTCIIAEAIAAADVTAGTTTIRAWVVTNTQIWRCSMDATSTTALPFYDKTIDTVDHNTIDADDLTNGRMMLVDTGVDDDGNVMAYVTFRVPSTGNALS